MLYMKYCKNTNNYTDYDAYFQNEFEHMKQLESLMEQQGVSDLYKNLFPYYDSYGYTEEGTPYICMEYIPGNTLEQRLCNKIPSSKQLKPLLYKHQILHLYEQLNDAFYWLYQVGIIYLDLSPENIIVLNDNYDIKLIDFTHCYYLNSDTPYHCIDERLDSNLPICMQLRNAAALLFSRLFYSGNTHYNEYFSYASNNRIFFRDNYGSLLNFLFSPEDEESIFFDNEFSLIEWQKWYQLLLKSFK